MAVVMTERKRETESWGDDRLDDLNHKVDEGFKDMREEFRAMRGDTQAESRAMRGQIQVESQAIRDEIAASRRTFVQAAAAIWATSMIGFLGVIATILTKV